MRQILLFSLAGAAWSVPALAAAVASEGDAPEIVVVSATRIPTPQLQIASSVTVITADEIAARQEQSLPEVLKAVPGLNLIQQGGPGGLTSVFMRGTNSNHTKVLVDGIDVSDPSNPSATFDFGQFPTQDIETVEILRGPQSGLYGSDAIGGVINIITRSGSGPAQLTGSVEGGSFDTFNQSAGLRGSDDRFHYSANVEHLHSGSTPVTPLDLLAPAEARNNDYYDNFTASSKLGYDIAKGFDVGLVARYTDTKLRSTAEDYDTFPAFPFAQQSDSGTSEYYARVSAHSVSQDGFLDQTLGLAYTRKRTTDLEPESPETVDTGVRTKADWQGALRLSNRNTLVLGAEHAREQISAPITASTTIDSGYVELQSQLTDHLFSAVNARYDNNDRFGSKVTYRVAPVYVIEATGTRLKASVGTGFKAPTLEQLFQSFPAFDFFANPQLHPESSLGYDLGLEQAAGAFNFGVTYFRNNIRNLIDDNADFSSYANVGRAHTDGVESFVSYRPVSVLTVRADYTYTEATDDLLNEELLRRPKHKGSVSVSWQATQAFSLDATVLAVGSWIDGNRDFSIPRLNAPGYTLTNLAVSYAFDAHFAVYGRIDNLFDRHYQEPVGFLQPGLGVFAGIKTVL